MEETITIDEVKFDLIHNEDGSINIDRVFIDETERGKGHLGKALAKFVQDRKGIILTTSIRPDDYTEANTDKLRETFLKVGFTMLELDDTVYRNELEYIEF